MKLKHLRTEENTLNVDTNQMLHILDAYFPTVTNQESGFTQCRFSKYDACPIIDQVYRRTLL